MLINRFNILLSEGKKQNLTMRLLMLYAMFFDHSTEASKKETHYVSENEFALHGIETNQNNGSYGITTELSASQNESGFSSAQKMGIAAVAVAVVGGGGYAAHEHFSKKKSSETKKDNLEGKQDQRPHQEEQKQEETPVKKLKKYEKFKLNEALLAELAKEKTDQQTRREELIKKSNSYEDKHLFQQMIYHEKMHLQHVLNLLKQKYLFSRSTKQQKGTNAFITVFEEIKTNYQKLGLDPYVDFSNNCILLSNSDLKHLKETFIKIVNEKYPNQENKTFYKILEEESSLIINKGLIHNTFFIEVFSLIAVSFKMDFTDTNISNNLYVIRDTCSEIKDTYGAFDFLKLSEGTINTIKNKIANITDNVDACLFPEFAAECGTLDQKTIQEEFNSIKNANWDSLDKKHNKLNTLIQDIIANTYDRNVFLLDIALAKPEVKTLSQGEDEEKKSIDDKINEKNLREAYNKLQESVYITDFVMYDEKENAKTESTFKRKVDLLERNKNVILDKTNQILFIKDDVINVGKKTLYKHRIYNKNNTLVAEVTLSFDNSDGKLDRYDSLPRPSVKTKKNIKKNPQEQKNQKTNDDEFMNFSFERLSIDDLKNFSENTINLFTISTQDQEDKITKMQKEIDEIVTYLNSSEFFDYNMGNITLLKQTLVDLDEIVMLRGSSDYNYENIKSSLNEAIKIYYTIIQGIKDAIIEIQENKQVTPIKLDFAIQQKDMILKDIASCMKNKLLFNIFDVTDESSVIFNKDNIDWIVDKVLQNDDSISKNNTDLLQKIMSGGEPERFTKFVVDIIKTLEGKQYINIIDKGNEEENKQYTIINVLCNPYVFTNKGDLSLLNTISKLYFNKELIFNPKSMSESEKTGMENRIKDLSSKLNKIFDSQYEVLDNAVQNKYLARIVTLKNKINEINNNISIVQNSIVGLLKDDSNIKIETSSLIIESWQTFIATKSRLVQILNETNAKYELFLLAQKEKVKQYKKFLAIERDYEKFSGSTLNDVRLTGFYNHIVNNLTKIYMIIDQTAKIEQSFEKEELAADSSETDVETNLFVQNIAKLKYDIDSKNWQFVSKNLESLKYAIKTLIDMLSWDIKEDVINSYINDNVMPVITAILRVNQFMDLTVDNKENVEVIIGIVEIINNAVAKNKKPLMTKILADLKTQVVNILNQKTTYIDRDDSLIESSIESFDFNKMVRQLELVNNHNIEKIINNKLNEQNSLFKITVKFNKDSSEKFDVSMTNTQTGESISVPVSDTFFNQRKEVQNLRNMLIDSAVNNIVDVDSQNHKELLKKNILFIDHNPIVNELQFYKNYEILVTQTRAYYEDVIANSLKYTMVSLYQQLSKAKNDIIIDFVKNHFQESERQVIYEVMTDILKTINYEDQSILCLIIEQIEAEKMYTNKDQYNRCVEFVKGKLQQAIKNHLNEILTRLNNVVRSLKTKSSQVQLTKDMFNEVIEHYDKNEVSLQSMINLAGSIDQESKLDQHMFLTQVRRDYSNYDYGRSINDRGVDIFCDSNYQKNIKPPMVYEQQTENRYHSEVNNNNYEINDGKYGNESEVKKKNGMNDVKEKKSKQPIRRQVLSNSNTAEQGNYPEQRRQSVIEDNQQHFRIRKSWLEKKRE